ncbi:MAG: response regulator, partial [Acidobacteria bacterium]|nr:response regulator [Acidobacteriota bacterium]
MGWHRAGQLRFVQQGLEEAPNGNVAIQKLHEGFFDVVVSDLKMGGSNGIDVLKTAKALHPSTAVILMTAFGSVSTAVDAMKLGAFDYVQKPFEVEEMEAKIDKALEMRRMQHQIDFLRHAQGHQPLEHRHHEVPAAHARVEALKFHRRLRPAVKRAGGGSPLPVFAFGEPKILPRHTGQCHGSPEFVLALSVLRQFGSGGENFARMPC